MPRTANLEERTNVSLSLDKRARDQLAALARAGETTASAVVREAVKRMYQNEIGRKRAMKTFTHTPATEDSIRSVDLLAEQAAGAFGDFYTIDIYEDGRLLPEQANALYIPSEGRLGIAWGADATWADVKDVESGIEMWLNDPGAWEAAN